LRPSEQQFSDGLLISTPKQDKISLDYIIFRLSNHPHRLRPFMHQNNLRVTMLAGKIKIDKAMSAAGIKSKREV